MGQRPANCDKDDSLIYIHYADDGKTSSAFPCLCHQVHQIAVAVPGTIDRVSRGGIGVPSEGDAKFCPRGHVAVYNARTRVPGSGVSSGEWGSPEFVSAWSCTDSKCKFFERT